ncbi:CQI_4a_G0053390.mRNA.1.CDS.1 [Saccharomyces cerevisiae]|nr:CQI_4a_G0053390.mRNA.1.CDS.1 [Saccharomyces cerevisiae]CAI7475202.1 CQI_4a_G0053390.mRNA.1.CDS.1 [Saccharomyces cerevisiae]
MSGSYQHLSNVGSRVMKRLGNRPKNFLPHSEKFIKKSTPEFMKSDLKEVDEKTSFKSEKEWKFIPGDRVVVMSGASKGNIAVIKSFDKRTNSFILDENGPTKTVPVPKQFWLEGQTSHMITIPVSILGKDLRLVADIDDEKTPGKTRTVAVRDVSFNGSYYDADYKKVMPYRCVKGQPDLIIPWPKPDPIDVQTNLATDPVIAREQTFWVDSVVRNPIPKKAIPSIRNPHSKYKRGTLTAKDIAKLVAPEMPLTEVRKSHLAEKKELAEREVPKLTEEDIEAIGARVFEFLEKQKRE